MTQNINLTAGHSYLVFSESEITSSSITNNVLSIGNTGEMDLIDMGIGTDTTGEARVTLVCPSGV